MERPRIRYATGLVASTSVWSEFGRPDGARLVVIPAFVSHLDLNWEFAPQAHFLRGLAEGCRVITFDKRGTGLSTRDSGFGSLAERADDVRAVMDAAGWERAHLLGVSEGGPMAILAAASCTPIVSRAFRCTEPAPACSTTHRPTPSRRPTQRSKR